MADALFAVPRLAAIYDILDGERSDLDAYAPMAAEFGARSVLDIGCGTGTFGCLLVFLGDAEWAQVVDAAFRALRPVGRLVFESRIPERQAWRSWDGDYSRAHIAGVGGVKVRGELISVRGELVSFRRTYVFESDGAVPTSDSTLRFRGRDAMTASLAAAGFAVDEIREAPDRPGLEMVFVARRPAGARA
jgi:hypothetical protein